MVLTRSVQISLFLQLQLLLLHYYHPEVYFYVTLRLFSECRAKNTPWIWHSFTGELLYLVATIF